ncbi:hypothetical protein G4V39_08600 [Thermosulfuriphilus ammonigenes]|uniref:Uncharacterized protein n=1 Tax=Thermosulfuriphilus ammonigenes TaxID=1936021 RepID=A0A6G7PXQ0_9BACT|nr:hypothetical protein [Thermosulfuriphilus ammonigenes]MBA2849568.1 hypothetical protein [Thermosulfuriphilus ammonigenes]QIJ72326.1 hypothetical protein G4V39_08600 [Thermosulfuriphilus ammonigenes]
MEFLRRLKKIFQPERERPVIDLQEFFFQDRLTLLDGLIEEVEVGIKAMEDLLGNNQPLAPKKVRHLYRCLRRRMIEILNEFFSLTEGKHLLLAERFEEICSRIEAVIEGRPPRGQRLIIPLSSLDLEDSSWAGASLAALAEVKNYLRFPVTDGLLFTREAFSCLLRENDLEEEWLRLEGSLGQEEGLKMATEIRQKIEAASFPVRLEEALKKSLGHKEEGKFQKSLSLEVSLSFPEVKKRITGVSPEAKAILEAYRSLILTLLTDQRLLLTEDHLGGLRPIVIAGETVAPSLSGWLSISSEELSIQFDAPSIKIVFDPQPPFKSREALPEAFLGPEEITQLALLANRAANYLEQSLKMRWLKVRGGEFLISQLYLQGESFGGRIPATALFRAGSPGLVSGPLQDESSKEEGGEGILLINNDSHRPVHPALGILAREGNPASFLASVCRQKKIPFLVLDPKDEIPAGNLTLDANEGRIAPGGWIMNPEPPLHCRWQQNAPRRILRRMLNHIGSMSFPPPVHASEPRDCQTIVDLLVFIKDRVPISK